MKSLQFLSGGPDSIPATASWYIADLAEAKGRQQLLLRQAPQRLNALREHALIESAVSSNRIEGIEIDRQRIGTVIFGKPVLRDRDEEEVRGYREALNLIHGQAAKLTLSEKTILQLHRVARGDILDAGKYKERDSDIIERHANGRESVRFRTVSATEAPMCMAELISLWDRSLRERWVHPLIALAAFNLDFLCIHPFRDGNGRVSRLLLLLQCYHLGYDVGRYISLERMIEQNKERYYETLRMSSREWHEGRHDPWPYVNYILFILKSAYREFESRLELTKSRRGAKTEMIEAAIGAFTGEFSMAELERACPEASRDLIRKVLRNLQNSGNVECLGRGPGARWRKRGITPERG